MKDRKLEEISFWLYRNKRDYDEGVAKLIPASVELHKVKYPSYTSFETITYQGDLSEMKLGEFWCKQLFGFFPQRGSLWKITITGGAIQRQKVKVMPYSKHRLIVQSAYHNT